MVSLYNLGFANAAGVYVPGSGVWHLGRAFWTVGATHDPRIWENEDNQSTKIFSL